MAPEQARALADKFDRTGSLGPILEPTGAKRAIVRIEAGLRGWMQLMGRANELRLWKKTAPGGPGRRFRLLQYYRSPFARGPIEPRFPLPGIEPSGGQRYAYLDDRRALESPPVPTVDIDDNRHTQLHFLDHGNAVHDALVSEWSRIGKAVPICLRVHLPTGHPLATDAHSGTYLVAILTWVPGNIYFDELDRSAALTGLQELQDPGRTETVPRRHPADGGGTSRRPALARQPAHASLRCNGSAFTRGAVVTHGTVSSRGAMHAMESAGSRERSTTSES